jgi:hypothetical protein
MKRCRCLGVKQTHSRHRGNDASDPQETFAALDCCSAQGPSPPFRGSASMRGDQLPSPWKLRLQPRDPARRTLTPPQVKAAEPFQAGGRN